MGEVEKTERRKKDKVKRVKNGRIDQQEMI